MSRKNRTIRVKDLKVKETVKGGLNFASPVQSPSAPTQISAPNTQGILIGMLLPAVQK